jgi:hypothetical protein
MRTAIRLGALALLGLVAVAATCADGGSSPTDPGGDVPFTTLIQVAVPGQTGGQVREAIRDAATWSRRWAELRAGSSLPEAPPAVDFQRDMVIVAAMPTQSCVSKVTIRSIRGGGELRVDLLEEPPGPSCVCIVSQRPIHAVRLPRSDAAVQFAVTVSPHNC